MAATRATPLRPAARSRKWSKAASTTTVASSLNPSTFGASVTFTATVTGTAPTGSVNFTDGGDVARRLFRRGLAPASAIRAARHAPRQPGRRDAQHRRQLWRRRRQRRVDQRDAVAGGQGVGDSDDDDARQFAESVDVRRQRHLHRDGHRHRAHRQRQLHRRRRRRSPAAPPWRSPPAAATRAARTCSTASAESPARTASSQAYGGDAGKQPRRPARRCRRSSKQSAAPTTTTLASSLNPSTFGASVTFTATVTGTAPTGSVNFTDGGDVDRRLLRRRVAPAAATRAPRHA